MKRYLVNYGWPGHGQEWTPEMDEGEARELYDRLKALPDPPRRLRLLLVVALHEAHS